MSTIDWLVCGGAGAVLVFVIWWFSGAGRIERTAGWVERLVERFIDRPVQRIERRTLGLIEEGDRVADEEEEEEED